MFKMFRYLKGKAVLCAIISPIMMFLEVTMDLVQPKLMADIVDIGIANNDSQYVLYVGTKMIAASIIGLLGAVSCIYLSSLASIRLSQSIRQALFDKIQTLSYRDIDKLKTSSLITRLTNDVTQIQNMSLTLLKTMARSPFICIGSLVMSYILCRELANLLLFALAIIAVSVVLIIRISFPLYLKLQKKIDEMNMVMRENILGVQVIKVFNLVKRQISKFDKANDELKNQNIKAQNLNMILWPIVNMITNLTIIMTLWTGGFLVNNNVIQVGVIMAFINYVIRITNSLVIFSNALINLSRAKVSADRINEVLFMESDIKESQNPKKAENYDIEFNNVGFRYNENGEYALKNINLKIREGEKVGIIGSTGCGKSTLVNLLCRLYDVTEGEIEIGGVNIKDIKLSELRSDISLVTQDNIIFSGTIEDNIRFGRNDSSKEEVIKSAKDSSSYEFIMQKENQFESSLEQRGFNLSGGQKQRICIARALIKNSKIFIMDDSTSALDMATEAKVQNSIKERLKDRTIIVIAQRISGVMDADKIIVLNDGEIIDEGTHEYLIKHCTLYRKIALIQLGEEAEKIG